MGDLQEWPSAADFGPPIGVDLKLWPTVADTLWVGSFGNLLLPTATEARKTRTNKQQQQQTKYNIEA
jgi:hypothetical protein